MLKPFGVDTLVRHAYFIGQEGCGFWLLSVRDRLFGEARMLQEATNKLQNLELLSAFLIIRILNEHYDELREEYMQLPPNHPRADSLSYSELKELDPQEMRIKLEIYVRRLISEFQISHPVLTLYQQEVGKSIIDSNSFDYKTTVIATALKCRAITNPVHLIINTEDPEKATLTKDAEVGIPDLTPLDLENSFIPESLLALIFRFADTEHKGLKWQTKKELASKLHKVAEELQEPTDEKKA